MKYSKILHRSIYKEFLKVFDEINSKVLNNREHEEVICLFFVMSCVESKVVNCIYELPGI